MSNGDVDSFFANLQKMLSTISTASNAWAYIAIDLTNYAMGQSASDQTSLNGLENTLLESWSGSAAGEFQKKADALKKFMLDMAANANKAKATFNMVLNGVQNELNWVQQQKLNNIDPAWDRWRTDIALQVRQAIINQANAKYASSSSSGAASASISKYQGADDWAHASGNWYSGIQNFIGTTGEVLTGGGWFSVPANPIPVTNFQDWCNRVKKTTATITWKQDFTLIYSDPANNDSWTSHDWEPQKAPLGVWDLNATVTAMNGWLKNASINAYHNVLRQELSTVSDQYVKLVSSLPKPLDNRDIGQAGSGTSPSMPGGPGSLGDNPFGTGTSNPDTGLAGLGPGGLNPGSNDPGALNPDTLSPGGLGSGGPAGGAWDPSSLAGFNPAGAGGGLGTSGLGSGTGLSSGARLGTGAGDAGAGAGGANGGVAGTAGRAMPMAPMGGAGAGKDSEGRQRAVYLTEDEDVWGANGDGGAAVL
jgi:hypothetical protein